MHHAIRALIPTLLMLAAACGGPGQAGTATPSPGAGRGAAVDACRILTADDIHTALGVTVSPLPMGSPPADGGGGGGAGSLISGCTYAATGTSGAGASLFLFADTPVDSFASVPGYTKVPGVGDSAFVSAPRLLGKKGHVTFQIVVEMDADKATQEAKLKALGRTVASRL